MDWFWWSVGVHVGCVNRFFPTNNRQLFTRSITPNTWYGLIRTWIIKTIHSYKVVADKSKHKVYIHMQPRCKYRISLKEHSHSYHHISVPMFDGVLFCNHVIPTTSKYYLTTGGFWFWRYLTRVLIWHLSQYSIRPSIYFSSIVTSRSSCKMKLDGHSSMCSNVVWVSLP